MEKKSKIEKLKIFFKKEDVSFEKVVIEKINEIIDHLNSQDQEGVFTEFTDKNISDDIPMGFVKIDGKLLLESNMKNKDKEMVAQSNVELGDLFAQAISKAKREAQIEVLTDIFQVCYQEDSKTLELVEEKLSQLITK